MPPYDLVTLPASCTVVPVAVTVRVPIRVIAVPQVPATTGPTLAVAAGSTLEPANEALIVPDTLSGTLTR
jgi:hypothetical protein